MQELTRELEVKNRELARKNRLADLGQMASHVAHEVRNNLVPVTLYLSLLRRRISGDSGSRDILDKITAGFTALDVMVNDLLHFTSDRDPHVQTFSIARTGRRRVFGAGPAIVGPGGRCGQSTCPPSLWLTADRDMLRRAVLNMVLNAMDAMPEGGTLTITACATPRGVELEIADTGPGLPRRSCRGYSSRFSPPSRTAPAWDWPSWRGSPKSTAAQADRRQLPRGRRRLHSPHSSPRALEAAA